MPSDYKKEAQVGDEGAFSVYIPRHISRTSDNLVIIEETAAAQIACVSRQLSADPNVAFACLQANGFMKKMRNEKQMLMKSNRQAAG